jgi:hypothetical protein
MIQDMGNRLQDGAPAGPLDPSLAPTPVGSLMPESLFQVVWRHSCRIIGTTAVALARDLIDQRLCSAEALEEGRICLRFKPDHVGANRPVEKPCLKPQAANR